LDFEYDTQGRRIRKRVWNNTSGTGSPTLERRYVYDGWNVLVELDGANGLVQSYVWGLDLSGSLQGAGGVGGLVAVRPTGSPARFTVVDGNGNVSALVNGATGQFDAQYEYGPFGEVLRVSGSMAKANPFRFSTKYQDDETEFLYYGYRYYDARNGRWVNRDPVGETGGANLYGFVGNSPLSTIDPLGMDYSWPVVPPPGYPPIFPPRPPQPSSPDPNKLEGFAICQRNINEVDVYDKCVNKCGGNHRYVQHYDGTTRWAYGFSQSGVKPEVIFKPNSCSSCKPSNSILQYGGGKGKAGNDATVEEIKDCIKNTPPRYNYLFLWYDCRHWASDAASKCGLSCD